MIKCPNCGSTAQVKFNDAYFHNYEELVERISIYSCGCGQHFKVIQPFEMAPYCSIEKMFVQSAKTIRSEMTKKMNYRRKTY